MTEKKEKSIKLHELIGRILDKERDKSYSGKFAGTYFYRLNVAIENKEGINTIFAFKDTIAKESLWKDLEESNYIDKRYLFYCLLKVRKGKKCFGLVNWKEINNHGSN